MLSVCTAHAALHPDGRRALVQADVATNLWAVGAPQAQQPRREVESGDQAAEIRIDSCAEGVVRLQEIIESLFSCTGRISSTST